MILHHDQIVPTELYLICVGSKTITAKQSTLGRAKTSVSRAKTTVVNIPSRQVEQEAFGEVVLIMETVDKAPSYS